MRTFTIEFKGQTPAFEVVQAESVNNFNGFAMFSVWNMESMINQNVAMYPMEDIKRVTSVENRNEV